MALRDVIRSLAGKKENAAAKREEENKGRLLTAADFPIMAASDVDLSRYSKVPLLQLAALGAAFATLPEAARTINETVTAHMAADAPAFAGVWPQGAAGQMLDQAQGLSGGLASPEGVGRMRYDLLDGALPLKATASTVIPFDPMTMVVAAALMGMDKKLDALQAKAEETLQFLRLEKQARQRGNLSMLSEIMEEFRQGGSDGKLCALRAVSVQEIRRQAHQDVLFYQEQIARRLREQKAIHGAKNARALLDALMQEFCEFQLAGYLYAYTSFMEALLLRRFEAAGGMADKVEAHAKKYAQLYADCRAQIAVYQRSAIEAKILGGLGQAAKSAGKTIAAMPVVSRGPVDEALISAGDSLGRRNRDAVARSVEAFEPLSDPHMDDFAQSMRRMALLCGRADGMITDGENLYILESA